MTAGNEANCWERGGEVVGVGVAGKQDGSLQDGSLHADQKLRLAARHTQTQCATFIYKVYIITTNRLLRDDQNCPPISVPAASGYTSVPILDFKTAPSAAVPPSHQLIVSSNLDVPPSHQLIVSSNLNVPPSHQLIVSSNLDVRAAAGTVRGQKARPPTRKQSRRPLNCPTDFYEWHGL